MKFGEDPILITLFDLLAILLSHLQTAVVGGAQISMEQDACITIT
jgi:hypothetical protein